MSEEGLTLRIEAGQEVAVASTKAFMNQALALLTLAKAVGDARGHSERIGLQEITYQLYSLL